MKLKLYTPRELPPERYHLVEDNMPLAKFVAKNLWRNSQTRPLLKRLGNFMDVLSLSYLGLVRAAISHDPHRLVKGKPVRFSTFAHTCCANEILGAMERTGIIKVPSYALNPKRKVGDYSASPETALAADRALFPKHLYPDRSHHYAVPKVVEREPDEYDGLYEAIKKLDKKNQEMIHAIFGLGGSSSSGMTSKSWSEHVGVTRQAISLRLKRVLRLLREMLSEQEIEHSLRSMKGVS